MQHITGACVIRMCVPNHATIICGETHGDASLVLNAAHYSSITTYTFHLFSAAE